MAGFQMSTEVESDPPAKLRFVQRRPTEMFEWVSHFAQLLSLRRRLPLLSYKHLHKAERLRDAPSTPQQGAQSRVRRFTWSLHIGLADAYRRQREHRILPGHSSSMMWNP